MQNLFVLSPVKDLVPLSLEFLDLALACIAMSA